MFKKVKVDGYNYVVFTDDKTFVKVGAFSRGKKFYGIAKCDPSDTFNYDTGFDIALARCQAKLLRDKVKSHQNDIKEVRNTINWLSGYLTKLEKREMASHARLSELLDSNPELFGKEYLV